MTSVAPDEIKWNRRPCWLPTADPGRRSPILLVLAVMCLQLTGCHPLLYREKSSVLVNGARAVIGEPRQFPMHKNDFFARMRGRMMARQAWAQVVASGTGGPYSDHYYCGFMDGYSDYLYAGGTGEPPLVPPRRYWNEGYRTPAGRQAIEAWFQGFRHGATTCREQGFRQLATVPSSVQVPQQEMGYEPELETLPLEIMPPLEEVVPEQLPLSQTESGQKGTVSTDTDPRGTAPAGTGAARVARQRKSDPPTRVGPVVWSSNRQRPWRAPARSEPGAGAGRTPATDDFRLGE